MTRRLLKAVSIILFIFSSSNFALSQGEANIWYFGTKGGLDFNFNPPVKLSNSAMSLGAYNGEGMATICNAAGALLFYTDGTNVYRANHTLMTGGTGLAGNTSSAQTSLIVPVPGSTNLYYIFSTPGIEQSTVSGTGVADGNNGLRYSIVNTTTNTVSNKNTLLTPAGVPITEGQTAVPHFDGTSFWLICKQAGNKSTGASSNNFYAYRVGTNNITPATGVINNLNGTVDEVISGTGSAIAGITGAGASTNGIITIKANTCFNKLAVAFFANGTIGKRVELFNFNNNTGVIGLANSITNFDAGDVNEVYGIEFSPNGDFLYASIMNFGASNSVRGSIYQFDISSGVNATINAAAQRYKSDVTTAVSRGLGALQLAVDGKIYYTYFQNDPLGSGGPNPQYIGRISSPDVAGAGATFDDTFISFTNALNTGVGTKMGLPQVYKGFIAGSVDFGDDLITVGNDKIVCKGASTLFTLAFTGTLSTDADAVTWDFGDGTSTTNVHNPTHVFNPATTPTIYTVTVTVKDICNNPYIQTGTVRVDQVIPAGNVSCSNPSIILNGTGAGAANYVWYDAIGGAPIGYGATVPKTYTPATSTPSTFYAFDATPVTGNLAVGNAAQTNGWSSATLFTSFTLGFKSILNSVKVKGANNSTNVTFTIRQGATVIATLPVIASIPSGTVVTLDFNEILNPGTYEIYASTGSFEWSNNIGNARDIPGVATVTGDGSGSTSGPFYDLRLGVVSPCSSRLTVSRVCSLPVTFISFNASRSNQATAVTLNWSTATEQNAKVFYVQRSVDGINFETIGQVAAAGNSSSVLNYEYIDTNAPAGNVYYRLAEEDFDGASMYSNIVYVNGVGVLNLSLVPNPGNGSFRIIGLSGDEKIAVSVYTITGQSVYSSSVTAGELVDLGTIAKGFYVVRVLVGNTEQAIRFINQ